MEIRWNAPQRSLGREQFKGEPCFGGEDFLVLNKDGKLCVQRSLDSLGKCGLLGEFRIACDKFIFSLELTMI